MWRVGGESQKHEYLSKKPNTGAACGQGREKKPIYWECVRSSKIHVSSMKILGNMPEVKQVFHKKKIKK